MADERFRRALRGYDPGQVEAALSERDERVARLEQEAAKLAKRVAEQEQRLRESLDEGGGFGSVSPGAIGALGKRLEEIHGQARSQATRMRMKALQDAVRMSERVSELAKLRDDLAARVQELAGMAGINVASGEEAVGMEAAGAGGARRGPGGEGVYLGEVRVEAGPFADFAQLTTLEDALGTVPGASAVMIRSFASQRATLTMTLSEPVELARELGSRVPFRFSVRAAAHDHLLLDVEAAQQRRAA